MRKEDFRQDGKDVRTISGAHIMLTTTRGRQVGLDHRRAEEQRRRETTSAMRQPQSRDRDIRTVHCQKIAQVPARQVYHRQPPQQPPPARLNRHRCSQPAQLQPEQESFHHFGSRDTLQKAVLTLLTTTLEPRHGSTHVASSTFACMEDKIRLIPSSSSQCRSLVRFHLDGKCV